MKLKDLIDNIKTSGYFTAQQAETAAAHLKLAYELGIRDAKIKILKYIKKNSYENNYEN